MEMLAISSTVGPVELNFVSDSNDIIQHFTWITGMVKQTLLRQYQIC